MYKDYETDNDLQSISKLYAEYLTEIYKKFNELY